MLELRGLSATFGSVRALRDVTLTVEKAEFVCVLGPSGCGKSTLLNCVSGFVRPDAGEIVIDGVTAGDLPPNRRPTAMVFQNYALFPHLDVYANVAFGLHVRRHDAATIRRKVGAALDLVKLPDVGPRFPRQLSGGQQQRVALARALVIEPKVLLLDEPFSNLDAKLREMMRIELKELQRSIGITTLFVTHDQEEAFDLGDRIVLMNEGRIEQVGAAADLYEQPTTMFVANFIGRANIIEGRIARMVEGEAIVVAGNLNFRARISHGTEGQSVRLLLRPEQISVTAAEQRAANVLRGTVRWASHLGAGIRHVVDVDKLSLTAVSPNARQGMLPIGSQACVSFGSDLYLLPDGSRPGNQPSDADATG